MGIDKILIVDNDVKLLSDLKTGLLKFGQFQVMTAADGLQAMAILKRERIAILVTGLKIPRMDGLEILAYVTREYPNILSIVTITLQGEVMEKQSRGDGLFAYLNKPFNHIILHGELIKMLDYRDEVYFQAGIFLLAMLPLVNLEQKTCLLEVSCGIKRKGFFYFDQGIICDVRCNNLTGAEALKEMLNWGPGRYWFKPLPDDPAVREFNHDLTALIMKETLFKKLKVKNDQPRKWQESPG